jgi:hypothetical protein
MADAYSSLDRKVEGKEGKAIIKGFVCVRSTDDWRVDYSH